jgi:hypothetical protein
MPDEFLRRATGKSLGPITYHRAWAHRLEPPNGAIAAAQDNIERSEVPCAVDAVAAINISP